MTKGLDQVEAGFAMLEMKQRMQHKGALSKIISHHVPAWSV